jgi:flagellar protein FliS
MKRTDLAYRRNSAESACGLGLLISLFDTLAGDLRRAAEAQRDDDIERRCREARHALVILGYLEDWVNRGTGGVLAQQLTDFYASLRRKLIKAEVNKSARLLEELMAGVLQLRGQWQQIELRSEPSGPEILRPAIQIPPGYPAPRKENQCGSWSA